MYIWYVKLIYHYIPDIEYQIYSILVDPCNKLITFPFAFRFACFNLFDFLPQQMPFFLICLLWFALLYIVLYVSYYIIPSSASSRLLTTPHLLNAAQFISAPDSSAGSTAHAGRQSWPAVLTLNPIQRSQPAILTGYSAPSPHHRLYHDVPRTITPPTRPILRSGQHLWPRSLAKICSRIRPPNRRTLLNY